MSRQWWYRDVAGATQGPFPPEDMRSWFQDGFLVADLVIADW
jgi:hypothetical protein